MDSLCKYRCVLRSCSERLRTSSNSKQKPHRSPNVKFRYVTSSKVKTTFSHAVINEKQQCSGGILPLFLKFRGISTRFYHGYYEKFPPPKKKSNLKDLFFQAERLMHTQQGWPERQTAETLDLGDKIRQELRVKRNEFFSFLWFLI